MEANFFYKTFGTYDAICPNITEPRVITDFRGLYMQVVKCENATEGTTPYADDFPCNDLDPISRFTNFQFNFTLVSTNFDPTLYSESQQLQLYTMIERE